MKTLVIAAHVGPAAAPEFAAVLGDDVELRCFVENGLSSAYHALAARLRGPDGRLLPALIAHAGARSDVEAYDRIILLTWSAPYALAEELLSHPDDAASISGWVALDSGYGVPTPGVIDLARRAYAGKSLYWAGATDVPTVGYADSRHFLASIASQIGATWNGYGSSICGLLRFEQWAHDGSALAAAHDQGAFWRAEHIAALHRGPAFLAAALAALGAGTVAPTIDRSPPTLKTSRSMAIGARGDDVVELQRLLTAAGATPTVIADGAFGVRTQAAIVQTQVAFGTFANGIADPDFVSNLRDAVEAAKTQPTPVTGDGLGARALRVALGELAAGVAEVPLGSNRGPQVDLYTRLVGTLGEPWCEAFESYCRRRAAGDGGADALGYHGAVAGLWRAAVQADPGRAHDPTWAPRVGDCAIFRRAGQDPRIGGEGHVGRVETVPDGYGKFTTIEGNAGNRIARATRSVHDPDLVGWVEVG